MNFDPDDFKPTQEHVQELFDVLKDGVERIVSEGDCPGAAPLVGVLCYDPFTGKEETRLNILADMGFDDNLNKKKAFKIVAANIFAAHRLPMAVGLVSEAWTAEMKGQEAMEEYYKKHLMIADDPNRVEVITVSAMGFPVKDSPAADCLGLADHRKIKRDAKEIISWDGDLLMPPEAGATYQCNLLGRFYEAYVAFGFKREDYKAYTAIAKEMAL